MACWYTHPIIRERIGSIPNLTTRNNNMKSKEEILKRNVEAIAKCKVKYSITQQGILNAMEEYARQFQEDNADKKYTENQLRDAIRNTITYLATLSETGKFHSGNIIEEAIINSLN